MNLWKDFNKEPFLINPISRRRKVKKKVAKRSKLSRVMKKAQSLIKKGMSKTKAMKKAWAANPKVKTKLGKKSRPAVYKTKKGYKQTKYRKIKLTLPVVNKPGKRGSYSVAKKRKIKRKRRNPVESLALMNRPSVKLSLPTVMGVAGGGLVSFIVAKSIIGKFLPGIWTGIGKPISIVGIGVVSGSLVKGKWGSAMIVGSVTIASVLFLSNLLNISVLEQGDEELLGAAIPDTGESNLGAVVDVEDEYNQGY